MVTFNNDDRRWLEIIFYLLCRKIFMINQKQQDILDFINGYRWTNMFDCDILINTIKKDKILVDSNFIPSKREFITVMNDNNCRLRTDKRSIRELIADTEYTYKNSDIFRTAMKEEVDPTLIYPRIQNNHVHETIYSFLLALRYIGDIVKPIKF